MKKLGAFCLCSILSCTIHADPIDFIGYKPVTITTHTSTNNGLSVSNQPKVILVQKIVLSSEAKSALKGRIDEMQTSQSAPYYHTLATTAIPAAVNLGMNGTPVLDQGYHGSCVTFAVTGAIDAAIGKGNYVSQLCSLELGSYLVQIRKIPYSGWDGTWGTAVLNQINTYGVFPISIQTAYGCAGVKQYPLYTESNIGKPMTIAQYMAYSKPLSSYATWIVLADASSSFSSNFNPTTLLNNVKAQLRAGRRVTFGMLLDDTQGDAGAVGTHNKTYDSWVLTPSIATKAKNGSLDAGHEMIIIGYSDTATARTRDGKISTGLLILRNSWGPNAGDGGNYYMSYDYFKALTDEAAAIIKK